MRQACSIRTACTITATWAPCSASSSSGRCVHFAAVGRVEEVAQKERILKGEDQNALNDGFMTIWFRRKLLPWCISCKPQLRKRRVSPYYMRWRRGGALWERKGRKLHRQLLLMCAWMEPSDSIFMKKQYPCDYYLLFVQYIIEAVC